MASSDIDFPPDLRALEREYELIRELGQGGMAAVYLARHHSTGRLVAIKAIRARYLDDRDALARFAREARTVAELEHPNIVRTEAIEQIDNRAVAIIMEYAPGGTVRDRLREFGSLGAEDAEWILRDVASALGYAHRRGIVHRDVKPENIFLDATRRRALLSDFGIARRIDTDAAITLLGAALGTPQYMSPEQIDGQPVDGRSDVYSLGVLGWELLTGRRPWAGESLYGVIYKQKHENLPRITSLRPRVPANLLFAIEGALVKDRERRFQTMDQFLDQLTYNPPPLLSQSFPPGTTHSDYEPTLQFARLERDDASAVETSPEVGRTVLPVLREATPLPSLASLLPSKEIIVSDAPGDYPIPRRDPHAMPSFEPSGRRKGVIQTLALLAPLGVAAASLFVLLSGSSTAARRAGSSSARQNPSAGSVASDSAPEPRAVPTVSVRKSVDSAVVGGVRPRNASVVASAEHSTRKANPSSRTRVSGPKTPPRPSAVLAGRSAQSESTRAIASVRPADQPNRAAGVSGGEVEEDGRQPSAPFEDPFRIPSRETKPLGADGSVPSSRCVLAATADQQACLASYIAIGDAPLNRAFETLVGELRRVAHTPVGAPDPATVQRLRLEQRAWKSIRDSECPRQALPGAGPFWAQGQAECFTEMATARAAELRDAVKRLRRN